MLLFGRRFALRLKWAVYESYVRQATLYVSEACCLKEGEIGSLQRAERSMVIAIWNIYRFDVHVGFE